MFKFRYASYLFLVLALLVACGFGIIFFIQKKMYLPVVLIFTLLYPVSYFLGRKMTKVFLLLSCLKYIKNNNGIITRTQYETFMRSCARKGHAAANIEFYMEDIINTLYAEKLIEIEGDSIMLPAL